MNRSRPVEYTNVRITCSRLSILSVSNRASGLNLKASSHRYLMTFSGNFRIFFRASRISKSLPFCSGVRLPSRSAFKRTLYSPRRSLSGEIALSSNSRSLSWTKYTPSLLSSADAIFALFPTTSLLMVVQKVSQVTSVSKILAFAKEGRTFSKVFSIKRIFHRL